VRSCIRDGQENWPRPRGISCPEGVVPLLEPFIVKHEAFDDERPQGLGRPYAKLRDPVGIHAVSDRYNGIQVVKFHLSGASSLFSCWCYKRPNRGSPKVPAPRPQPDMDAKNFHSFL
jgi:hypothetical protein